MVTRDSARVLAFDMGASSGRAILAEWQKGSLEYREIHRFENIPVQEGGHLRWDFDALMREVRVGIEKAGAIDSVAFDTWGVDFGLLDSDLKLIENPVHYRDERTEGMLEYAFRSISPEKLYSMTGNQIMPINTLFQLLALKTREPELFARARTMLFMPDLFAYALSGNIAAETTMASTSQMFDPANRCYCSEVYELFGMGHLKARLVPNGAALGYTELSDGNRAQVITAGHDTQCAVAAMPAESDSAAFLSCGTWSLIGCELSSPILTEESMRAGLSNEMGANGRINYLKNIIGLWLIQECRNTWKKTRSISFAEIADEALKAESLHSYIDPDAPEFVPAGDMPKRIQEYCRRTNQRVPETVGEISRCIYESLALKYRYALEQIESLTKKRFSVLHILGGGANAELLCQMTADSCSIPVVAGPTEATALGNIIIQLKSLSCIDDLDEGRRVIARTEQVKTYQPKGDREYWAKAYADFCKLLSE